MFNDMADLLSLLCPEPFTHFLMAAAAPLSPVVRASSVPDVMHRLLLARNLMASPPDAAALAKQPPKLLGALDILQVGSTLEVVGGWIRTIRSDQKMGRRCPCTGETADPDVDVRPQRPTGVN